MSLFDSASLVVTPNGYKEDKLYSIKPTDGSGDLVVTRATTATRVNSDGLIEQVPYNLLQRSQEFENAYWTKATATISANATTAPNGTLTADKLIGNNLSTASNVNVAIVVSQGVNYNFSIYAKASGADWIQLIATGTTIASPARLWVNVSTGALGTNNGGFLNVNVSNEGNGWYRISGYFTTTSTTTTLYYAPATADNINGYNGNGTDGLFLWGAQLVSGTSAKEYFPTTDRLDVPRLDYTNSSCPSILVEPQRTNLLTYSEQFDNATWLKQNASVTSNSLISPSGLQDSDSLIASNGTANFKGIYVSQITAVPKTFSFFAKKGNKDWVILLGYNGDNNCWFNVSNGTIGTIGSNYINAKIENYGNGWYRCSATLNSLISGTNLGIYVSNSDNSISCTGDGTTPSLYIWGAQVEVGSYATSYIPTIASSVTRNADVISKTGISSLIGQTEGTLFVECNFKNIDNLNRRILSVSDGTSTNRINIYFTGTKLGLLARNSSGIFVNIENSVSDENVKICLKYNSTSYKFFVNGNVLNSSLFNIIPNLNVLQIGNFLNNEFLNDKINSAILWKTELTDQECINLTTI